MSSLEGISPLSLTPPDLRPELDRARLQTYQLTEVYNLQEQRMVTPIAYRDVREGIEVADPQLYDGLSRQRPVMPVSDSAPAEAVRKPRDEPVVEVGARRVTDADRTTERSDGSRTEKASSATSTAADGWVSPQDAASKPATLPYGADPARIRQLVDAIAAGQAFVPLVPHYRQAGDLLTVQPSPTSAGAPRPVAAVQRTF